MKRPAPTRPPPPPPPPAPLKTPKKSGFDLKRSITEIQITRSSGGNGIEEVELRIKDRGKRLGGADMMSQLQNTLKRRQKRASLQKRLEALAGNWSSSVRTVFSQAVLLRQSSFHNELQKSSVSKSPWLEDYREDYVIKITHFQPTSREQNQGSKDKANLPLWTKNLYSCSCNNDTMILRPLTTRPQDP